MRRHIKRYHRFGEVIDEICGKLTLTRPSANQIRRCDACCPAVPRLSLPRGYKWRAMFWNLRAPDGVVVERLAFGARGSKIDPRQSRNFVLIFPNLFPHGTFKDKTTPRGLGLMWWKSSNKLSDHKIPDFVLFFQRKHHFCFATLRYLGDFWYDESYLFLWVFLTVVLTNIVYIHKGQK